MLEGSPSSFQMLWNCFFAHTMAGCNRQEVPSRASKLGMGSFGRQQPSSTQEGRRVLRCPIYRHFESKQQLADEAFDYGWKIAMDTHFEGTEAISNAVDRLKQSVRNFGTSVRVPSGCPLHRRG